MDRHLIVVKLCLRVKQTRLILSNCLAFWMIYRSNIHRSKDTYYEYFTHLSRICMFLTVPDMQLGFVNENIFGKWYKWPYKWPLGSQYNGRSLLQQYTKGSEDIPLDECWRSVLVSVVVETMRKDKQDFFRL
jgi:hypothetical protein